MQLPLNTSFFASGRDWNRELGNLAARRDEDKIVLIRRLTPINMDWQNWAGREDH